MITYILLGICIVLLIAVIAILLTQAKGRFGKIEELQRQLLDAVNKNNNSARIEELSVK